MKKLSGANAQCSLYSLHDVGVKLMDNTLWSIVNNSSGHDVIRGHSLLIHKTATITGWIYPSAHYIEIDKITVDGISHEQIAKTALEEDIKVAKAITNRKVGEEPIHINQH